MRRWLPLAFASAVLCPVAAGARESVGEPFVAEFRLAARGVAVEALAWRAGGEIFVLPETLIALGIDAGDLPADAPTPLSGVEGASFQFNEAAQAVEITCARACYERQILTARRPAATPLSQASGGFVNMDLVGTEIAHTSTLAGAFELGLFRPGGFGGSSWTMGAAGGAEIVRLDTSWTFDFPDTRSRMRLGDAIASGGSIGAPFRFGGLQWGTDFSLDPSFVTFPIPSFSGEAAAPSTVELYINGALRLRERVDAGPFELTDAPVVAGAGVAQVVVTDALGREQMIGAPFYASPLLLRPGLTDFSVAVGAEREHFARESANYGRPFVLGAYRRGLTEHLTAEARGEIGEDIASLGGALAFASSALGEWNARAAVSSGARGDGGFAGIGWAYAGQTLTLAADIEAASASFERLGQRETLARRRARATFGLELGRYGSLSVSGALQQTRAQPRVETLSFAYAPPAAAFGALSFTALYVDDGDPFAAFGVSLVRPLGARGSGMAAVQADDGAVTARARLQSAAPLDGGWGWRLGASQGEDERFDAALTLRGATFEARIEASRAPGADGLRGQFETALAWMRGAIMPARPIRESFALVDIGFPGVTVRRDRQALGRTDAAGRLLVTGLRAYDVNRIGFDLDDVPLGAVIDVDEVMVRPAARSGAYVAFPIASGAFGEVRVVDASGLPLPEGTMLARDIDAERFPVGRGGRVYISSVNGAATLVAEGEKSCRVVVTAASLASSEPLQCV